MSLFRIWPFRILLLTVVALLATDLTLITTFGRPSAPVALHVVRAATTTTEPSAPQELRELRGQAASRSMQRLPLSKRRHAKSRPQAHPHVVDAASRPQKAVAVPVGAYGWAHQSFSILVANCESGGTRQGRRYNGDAHNQNNPSYRGKWQMGYAEWADEGGSGDPADASEAEQDYRAWKLWKARGWSPWQCAGMV